MRKQDILTPIGIIAGFGFVVFGISLGTVGMSSFVSISSLAITLGGSFAGLLIAYPLSEIKVMLKMSKKLITDTGDSREELLVRIKQITQKSRKEGVLSLESELESIEDDFLKKGLELVIDGVDTDTISSILTMDAQESERKYLKASQIYKTWGAYAPAFGMIGTLIGLIQMLADLQSPDAIAVGMANALITTFYGALFANLLFVPLGANLQVKAQKEIEYREMIIVGILSMVEQDNMSIMENKLMIFLDEKEKKGYFEKGVGTVAQ